MSGFRGPVLRDYPNTRESSGLSTEAKVAIAVGVGAAVAAGIYLYRSSRAPLICEYRVMFIQGNIVSLLRPKSQHHHAVTG